MRFEIYNKLKSTDGFVSGELLSSELGVTRAALWKHVKAMQADGAEIESVTGMGYRLIAPPSVPRAEYLYAHVRSSIPIEYLKSVGSTNDAAKQSAVKDESAVGVFIAGEQTAGRGRKGRSWRSDSDNGVYITFLLRPNIDPALISGLTLVAAISLCDAISQITGLDVGIKWPNDIILNGKKTAGILTESMIGMDGVDYIVCGMGINTSTARFDGDLKDKAASLGENTEVNRMLLSAAVIDTLLDEYTKYTKNGLAPFMPKFRQRNVLFGTVHIISPSSEHIGEFIDFDDEGAILVDCGDEAKRFIAGEVSLRGENGYV